MRRFRLGPVLGMVLIVSGCVVRAQDNTTSPDDLKHGIVTRSPEIKVDKVDHDRLVVHRIDIVDDKGVIRATLAASAPAPVIGGVQYKRVFPVAGLVLFDRDGNERSGTAIADIDGSVVATAADHVNGDALGWRVMPDGSVTFQINERAPVRRDPVHGNVLPGFGAGATRIAMSVAQDGTPAIALQDKQSRPRLRLTITAEGYGAIEFLDANGHVVDTFAPEAGKKAP